MKENEHAVSELAFLFKLLPVMQELETVDEIYRLLMAIVTTGHAVGYPRAMLFVINEREATIGGRYGVVQETAGRRAAVSFEDRARDVFSIFENVESSDLTVQVRSFSVPLAWHRSALVKAARTAYPVLAEREISDFSSDPFFSFFESNSYIAVPIRVNGRVAAVLAADRGVKREVGSVEDISVLYSLAQQASAAAQNIIDLSEHRRKSRIVRKLQMTLTAANTREKLEEALRLGLIMVSRAVGSSGCMLKDLTKQKTIHIKTVHEYTPDITDDDIAIAESFDAILDIATTSSEPIVADKDHPALNATAAKRLAHFCALPLIAGDSVAGSMAVYKETDDEAPAPPGYSEEDISFVGLCAWIVAAKLETVQLEHRIERSEELLLEVSSNLARERERSRLAERAIDFHAQMTDDLKSLSTLLASKLPLSKRVPQATELVKEMRRSTKDHVKEIYAKKTHYELVDLFEVTRRVVQDWSSVLRGDGVDITARVPASGPMLLMDRSKVSLALENILRATASCLKKGDKMLVECTASDDRVLVCFADNSEGLPGDAVSRLVMPFAEVEGVDESKQSLSLAGEIIQKHSGEILIKSSMSWKTILVLSFPKGANRDRRRTRRDRRRRHERRTIASS